MLFRISVKSPPRARRLPIQKVCNGHKSINDAWIVTLTGFPAKALVHLKRAFANKLFRRLEPEQKLLTIWLKCILFFSYNAQVSGSLRLTRWLESHIHL